MATLPSGFEIEQPAQQQAAAPILPEGFEIEQAQAQPVAPPFERVPQQVPEQPLQQPVGGFGPRQQREAAPEREPTRAELELPELGQGGLLSGEDTAKVAAVAPVLLTTTNPQEIGQILQSNFPDIGISQDEGGNLIAANNKTGVQVVINKPGLSQLDVMQFLGLATAFTPAGRAASVPIAAVKTAATETALQTAQAAAGGEFDPEDVALATVAGAGGQKLSDIIGQGIRSAVPSAKTATQRATAQGADEIPGPSTDEQRRVLASTIAKGKAQDIAAEAVPDQKIIDAADELGVDILPSASSQNLIFRELEQGLKSVPGSQLKERESAGITTLAQKADDLITEFGGSLDKSQVGLNLERQATETIDQMFKRADKLYGKLRRIIPAKAQVSADEVLGFIRNRSDEFGGDEELTRLERHLLERLDPLTNPTYARLDELRKRAGAAKRGQGDELFTSAEKGLLTKIESLMLDGQKRAADEFGASKLFDSARTLVAQRKTLEDNLQETFGRKLQKDIIPTVGRALKELGKGSFKPFRDTISRIPQENRQEVVLTALNDVFTLGSRKEQQLSIAGFDDWYKGLRRNKEAFTLLKDNLPEGASKRLDLIATVAGGVRRAQESEIKTGRIIAVPELFDQLETKLGRIFGVGLKAAAAEVPGSAVGLPGVASATVITNALARGKTSRSAAADALLASPVFKKTLESISTKRDEIAAEQAQKLVKTKAFKSWLKTLTATESRAISDVGFIQWLSADRPEAQTAETETQQSQ